MSAWRREPASQRRFHATSLTALDSGLARHSKSAGVTFIHELSLDVDPNESVLSRRRAEANGSMPQIAFREAPERVDGCADSRSWKRIKFLTLEYHLRPGSII